MTTPKYKHFKFEDRYVIQRMEYVTQAFEGLKTLLGDQEFSRLFEVILTDNGTEFFDPESIEVSSEINYYFFSTFLCWYILSSARFVQASISSSGCRLS